MITNNIQLPYGVLSPGRIGIWSVQWFWVFLLRIRGEKLCLGFISTQPSVVRLNLGLDLTFESFLASPVRFPCQL